MLYHDPSFHRLQLPRYDVRVVLHLCDDDLVACFHLALAKRLSHQINRLRSASCKHYFLYLAGIDKRTHFLASCFVQVGSLLTQIVHPSMHVCIDVQILVAHGVEHHQRFLRSSRIIQINQWFTIHFARQNREVFSYLINIIHR